MVGTKKRRSLPATPLTDQCKCKNNSRIKSTVKGVFSSGRKVTARELNEITGGNDARKVISDLRKEGSPIVDLRNPDGTKTYWMLTDERQFDMFKEGGEV